MTPIVESPVQARSANFTRYAWGVLAWILVVVLWGAFVRASKSGEGCGSNWPLCNGEVIPLSPTIHTIIEFTHRVTSAMTFIPVIALVVWSVILFRAGHRARRIAILSVIFLATEALLGMGLVLLRYVGQNASIGRTAYLSLHLANTQFLLAALALCAWFSRDRVNGPFRLSGNLVAALALAIIVSVTGAIAALGDTLYPATSLAEGMRQDVSSAASFLVRLRVLHPILAVLAGVYFALVAINIMRSKPDPLTGRVALTLLVVTVAQLCAGAINLALLAPVWMQITHLLLANLVWLALVILTVQVGQTIAVCGLPTDDKRRSSIPPEHKGPA